MKTATGSQLAAATPAAPGRVQRLVSLDAFRGATIVSMLIVNNPGDGKNVFHQLDHAPWNGWTFTDLIFPFFLWIVGVSMTISIARRIEAGAARWRLFGQVARRAATIFLIGLAINFTSRWSFATVRIMGVLQRIGLCYLIAGAIYIAWPRLKPVLLASAVMLAVYWVSMMAVPVPGFGPGVLTPEGNFARWIDGFVLSGHMWSVTRVWDPEGLVSSLPAIATTLFGVTCGLLLRGSMPTSVKTAWMFTIGAALIFAGAVMNIWLPINKNLWTSSYSVFMAGMAYAVFAWFYWVIDVQGFSGWARPFVMFGSNAIALFVLSDALAITMIKMHWVRPVFDAVFAGVGPPKIASLSFALAHVAIMGLAAWLLWRKRLFLRV
jgi:predicted acyltransferase